MSDEKPVVYILRGDDREGIESHIRRFRNNLGAADLVEMNTTRLLGNTTSLNDLRTAALAVPFLAERRLVIVEDALSTYLGQGKQTERLQFLSFLDSLPQTTALVLIIPDIRKYRQGSYQWATLTDRHWLIQWVKGAGKRVYLVDCALPADREMPNWIKQKAVEFGGIFTGQAAVTLTEYVGNNTQRAAQEIVKLLTYVDFARPVDDDDVYLLTAQDQQGDIFFLVDAIGRRDGQRAQQMLHLLLEKSEPLQLFGMITRQFRLLIQAREHIDLGRNENDLPVLLKQHKFVSQKIAAQCRAFDMTTLESIFHRLLKIDLDMKTGGMAGDIALDLLIAQLANSGR